MATIGAADGDENGRGPTSSCEGGAMITASNPGAGAAFTPLADVEETDDAWIIQLELPGVRRRDVDVELSGRRVVIRGERKEPERHGVLRHRSRVTGTFCYEVTLPTPLGADVDAKLSHGELTVHVPKAGPEPPQRVPVSG
jgi:HSP20 family protein